MKILIIEYSKTFAHLLQKTLRTIGMEFEYYSNTKQGLERCKQVKFSAITISHENSKNYQVFAKNIKELPHYNHCPIYLFTSQFSQDLLIEAFNANITEVFAKQNFLSIIHSLKRSALLENIASQAKILYVDDSLAQSSNTILQLQQIGYQVKHVSNASNAIDLIEHNQFDLAIVDLILDKGDSGLSVVKYIRALSDDIQQQMPVIVLTNDADKARLLDVFLIGGNDYMIKPVHFDELNLRIRSLIMHYREYRETKLENNKLEKIALTDELSNLYNRHGFNETSRHTFDYASRKKLPIAFMLIDIDLFKEINDNFGHQIGDEIIAAVGSVLNSCLRQQDIAARWGGDEFLVFFSDCDEQNARTVAQRIQHKFNLKTAKYQCSCSIGLVALDQINQREFSQLYDLADQALYEAKERGRNQVVMHDLSGNITMISNGPSITGSNNLMQ
ncbi:diguanylate cyclase [Marinicellulosiphila megalodicopiae]|uniref:diguanylate cyclase n=1 Tax=Marinicellulosiphila megalodicopiae TaxID=2724896 RepID=UPI003BB1FA98